MKSIPIFAQAKGRPGYQIGELVLHVSATVLDDPDMQLYGEDCGLTDVGIHIQSFTANPDRMPKEQVSDDSTGH